MLRHKIIRIGGVSIGVASLGTIINIAGPQEDFPQAFAVVGGAETSVSVGDVREISEGNVIAVGVKPPGGDCSFPRVRVGATLPNTIRYSSIELDTDLSSCEVRVSSIEYSTDPNPGAASQLEGLVEGDRLTPFSESPLPIGVAVESEDGSGEAGLGPLGHLPLEPLIARASTRYVVSAKAMWRTHVLVVLTIARADLFYQDNGTSLSDGSTFQACAHQPWWAEDGCYESSDTSDGQFMSATTGGDFHLVGPVIEHAHYLDAIAWASPGSWGHTCTFEPSYLGILLRKKCDGERGTS